MSPASFSEEILTSLIHDLRQPLGNLETCLFYLHMVLDGSSGRVRQQLEAMERQVTEAAQLLQHAGEELRAGRAQPAAVDNLPLTKSATAGVT